MIKTSSKNVLEKVWISGKLVDPLIEGGKGIGASDGRSAGAWAACGGVGTFSGSSADYYYPDGAVHPYTFVQATRTERHLEIIEQESLGAIAQAEIAHKIAGGRGCIHMNVLWEAGGVPQILHNSLKEVGHLIDGVVCGAGLPFELAEICAKYNVYYNPIVSSALAFKVLWQRAFKKYPNLLGSVIYEDPWQAGGHNGISSRENPLVPERPLERVLAIRQAMKEYGLEHITIIIAGGVWNLAEWREYLENDELKPIAFQFGTRPLLTQESPIQLAWKKRLYELEEGAVKLHKFSPTGFFSSAVHNPFLQELMERSERQVSFGSEPSLDYETEFQFGRRIIWLKSEDLPRIESWIAAGYTDPMRTPDDTLIFVDPVRRAQILEDQKNCMGCLNKCKFSNWSQYQGTTGIAADPRSFCIMKTLYDIAHGGSIENNLMFAGTSVSRFKDDPWEVYQKREIPTVQALYQRLIEEYQGG